VLAGSGARVVGSAVQEALPGAEVVRLDELVGEAVSTAACAYAVARLREARG
jgi:uncharacterized hydantoinase/oxoprolinase family protein